MTIKYDSRRESLAEVIKRATNNATYVIPDLQRPYVWTPRQVTLLVDSLFKGWPFGSLLLWEVKPDCFEGNDGIPHRPFWQVVDRTDGNGSTRASALGQPATYQMVLDGQQRVQSLVLALGGDQWGFQLFDADWAADLQDRRVRPSTHWSRGSLCLDLVKFQEELAAKRKKVRKLEAARILEWVVLDASSGRSPGPRPLNYIYPLPLAAENPGRYLRLWRFWELAQNDLAESEYGEMLGPLLAEHRVSEADQRELLLPLAQFMKVVESVKAKSFVHALQVESFQLTPQWNRDDYGDAIVTIFTRLNTAGRTLTREEITLAWLKVGWSQSETDGKGAGTCLEDLRQLLANYGFKLETDEIVRLIAFVWSVQQRNGKLLDSKDLLKGDVVRPMAGSIAAGWKGLINRIEEASQLIASRDLIENHESFNAVIVVFTWYKLVCDRAAICTGMTVPMRDDLDKRLHAIAERFFDRWIFASLWANVWGEGATRNFQDFADVLHAFANELERCTSESLVATVENGAQSLMAKVIPKALQYISNVVVADRARVHTYYPLLWVWHRLDVRRWACSSVPLRTGRKRTSKLEVDHVIADAWWQKLVEKIVRDMQASFAGPDEERMKLAPGGFGSSQEAATFINSLGNCLLLEKSFNISKSDHPMWHFLKEVHEFKENKMARSEWESALSLSNTFTEPHTCDFNALVKAISDRDSGMRAELTDFVNGNKARVDVDAFRADNAD